MLVLDKHTVMLQPQWLSLLAPLVVNYQLVVLTSQQVNVFMVDMMQWLKV